MKDLVVLGGSSHPQLTKAICSILNINESEMSLNKFSNGETSVTIKDSVRDKDVYVIQSGCGNVNDNLMELLIAVSALKTASASKVTAVLPLFPYSRQPDAPYRKTNTGYRQWVAQAGTLVADLLACAGTDHIITMDLHDPQFQGFFDIPVDNLYGKPLIQRYITSSVANYQDAVIVSPDAGGAKRASVIADALGMDFALIHKERKSTKVPGKAAPLMLVGSVHDRVALMIDDLIDTSATVTRAARLLKLNGATKVYCLATHGVFSGDAIDRVLQSDIDKVIVTNSVPQQDTKVRLGDRLEVVDISPIFAEAIRRIHNGESVSMLFDFSSM
ncbi:hypothetical protein CANCADRAFT_58695 [Tortispora caseinolytica NRRL Y-17796]|uniref:ribose-phosphate diphosphokinase n=1 Tax=Tortispora caseinolytica NRRL Y-17796 TaxID=767744 RepID=A0A1E4T9D4_9ASCO|nr:hypothetical protein CANCADRAFT_58695 [Tortispora caseinolytica NRRL Y-17796]